MIVPLLPRLFRLSLLVLVAVAGAVIGVIDGAQAQQTPSPVQLRCYEGLGSPFEVLVTSMDPALHAKILRRLGLNKLTQALVRAGRFKQSAGQALVEARKLCDQNRLAEVASIDRILAEIQAGKILATQDDILAIRENRNLYANVYKCRSLDRLTANATWVDVYLSTQRTCTAEEIENHQRQLQRTREAAEAAKAAKAAADSLGLLPPPEPHD
jgi:hypothetical protein